MRSIINVTQAAAETAITTVERVAAEFNLGPNVDEALIVEKIAEVTSRIEAELGFKLAYEELTETFRATRGSECADVLILARTPVVEISTITVDGAALTSPEFEFEEDTGLLHRLDTSGYPMAWGFCKSVIVAYGGGYIMPAESGRTLPPAIEGAAVKLFKSGWLGRGRDPLVKSESVPGLMTTEFWVGGPGSEGELPPDVVADLAPFRRVPA